MIIIIIVMISLFLYWVSYFSYVLSDMSLIYLLCICCLCGVSWTYLNMDLLLSYVMMMLFGWVVHTHLYACMYDYVLHMCKESKIIIMANICEKLRV